MKGLHLLTIGDFVFVFKHINGEKVMQLVAAQRLLKPWQPEIQEMYTSLQALPKGIDGADANPDDAAEAEAEAEADDVAQARTDFNDLDRTTEASIWAVKNGLGAGADQARGRRDLEAEARWRAAESFLFPDGLKFLRFSLADQVGETQRLLARAQAKEVKWLHKTWNLHGQTFAEMLTQILAHNEALHAALTEGAPLIQAAVSVAELRRRAQRLLSDLLPLIERSWEAQSSERATVLEPLLARVAFRVQKQAAQKKRDAAASDDPPATPLHESSN